MADPWILAVALVGTSALVAVAALLVIGFHAPAAAAPGPEPAAEAVAFLFDGTDLIDATAAGRQLLAAQGAGEDWARLMAYLASRFPGIEAELADAGPSGGLSRDSPVRPGLRLAAERRGTRLRLLLSGPGGGPAPGTDGGLRGPAADPLSQSALEEELAELRGIAEQAPLLIWRQTPDGAVTWANRAYLLLAAARDGEAGVLTWPLPRLFDPPAAEGAARGRRRARLELGGEARPRWFDLEVQRTGHDLLCFALPADAAVQAETALRDFVQTLTRTFAHLPIGLAIFDRRRELMLFNPALAELTSLPPEFLASRPTLAAFLDRLRERRMIPEPRDYRGWRQRLSAIEEAGTAGPHEETWTLPGGQTYRVTARPHADGGVAFLIEDISADVAATRRVRAQLATSHAVLDALDEAVAVFAPSGVLLLANAAYARLWGVDPSRAPSQIGIGDALRLWEQAAEPGPFPAAARRFVTAPDARTPQTAELTLRSGVRLAARLAPLPGGAALVGFRAIDIAAPAPDAADAPDAAGAGVAPGRLTAQG